MPNPLSLSLPFKSTVKFEDRYAITLWLLDSQVWMRIALDQERMSERSDSVVGGLSEDNVAHVCIGLAFELLVKALTKSEGGTVIPRHDLTSCFRALSPQS